ncbi:hypothetical protein EVAR_2938_1 [Eumeta japonica]|uniref:Uncharacterized protein n=1 Tax=Eumeta variegata TaxID=151549 RepID=A0A4C1T4F9_EUMVA|nr:hypothetical protein EVAR_2938_1 [Eumeta japonica]
MNFCKGLDEHLFWNEKLVLIRRVRRSDDRRTTLACYTPSSINEFSVEADFDNLEQRHETAAVGGARGRAAAGCNDSEERGASSMQKQTRHERRSGIPAPIPTECLN